jgi:4-hydroxythreonine-4-phosphate dehydrogenase
MQWHAVVPSASRAAAGSGMTPIAITSGEPSGIGPQIAVAAAVQSQAPTVLLGDDRLLAAAATRIGIDWPPPAHVQVKHVATAANVEPGRLDARNARYVLRLLDAAIDGCLSGRFRAMATAPVHKGVINDGGVPFTGHTEYLAERTKTPHVVMMLVGGGMRVALATTHLPLARVAAAITVPSLSATLDVLRGDLVRRFGLPRPRIGVAGLNPHAGEGGHLGREEIDVIAPALEAARTRGIDADGPFPADTLFVPAMLARFDAVLAMYHDQGLPVLKHASFGHGVNVTLGLPIVRTSVDHGTALDLAGTGMADVGSMKAALSLADELSRA